MKVLRAFVGCVLLCLALAVAVLGLGSCVCAVVAGVACCLATWVLALPFALLGLGLWASYRKPPTPIEPPPADPSAEPTE